jgi:hypothetical protein
LLFAALLFKNVYPFLATTHRVDAEVLVVEGWVHEYAIRAAVEESRRGSYQRVLTTGGPTQGSGHYINDYQTAASVGADLLRKNGLPNESLQMVLSRVMDHDRTYGSAIALRNWFHEKNMAVSGINVVTEDLHARRTLLRGFRKNVEMGLWGTQSDYDARHWWRYRWCSRTDRRDIAYMPGSSFIRYRHLIRRGACRFGISLISKKENSGCWASAKWGGQMATFPGSPCLRSGWRNRRPQDQNLSVA